ncbi:hypothetical protein FNV43_RR07315 [Rhamnella rubrinervis]|uniref:Thaumatin-like protein n=1 Tax=Rhamnella rubrinervis TaxID=2594499 RepID=A0A8K0MM89_9ROSA|nr:hypothetical protein FNV43_RR07315 [Rhamnella rubrinervis]
MAFFQNLSIFTFLLLTLAFPFANAATFEVRNNCGFTAAAAVHAFSQPPLPPKMPMGTAACNRQPRQRTQPVQQLGFLRHLLVDGFNVPMEFSPTSNGCTRVIRCTADINGQCPNELKAPGGCNNPCTVFKTDQYCCNSGSCEPTDYSKFFKSRCPDAYSYPKDDQTSTFTCPGGTNYKVVFCP